MAACAEPAAKGASSALPAGWSVGAAPRRPAGRELGTPLQYLATILAVTHTVVGQKSLLARVRRIKGQADALERLIEGGQDVDCHRVLQQIAAIRGAVAGLMAEVLEGHLREHVAADNITPEQRHDEIEEVVAALRTYLK